MRTVSDALKYRTTRQRTSARDTIHAPPPIPLPVHILHISQYSSEKKGEVCMEMEREEPRINLLTEKRKRWEEGKGR